MYGAGKNRHLPLIPELSTLNTFSLPRLLPPLALRPINPHYEART